MDLTPFTTTLCTRPVLYPVKSMPIQTMDGCHVSEAPRRGKTHIISVAGVSSGGLGRGSRLCLVMCMSLCISRVCSVC